LLNRLRPTDPTVALGDLLRNPHDRNQPLECRVLYLTRADESAVLLPHAHTAIRDGDNLLLVGRGGARQDLELTLNNENTFDYVLSGREVPGGWIWEWLTDGRARKAAAGDG
jgi:hypothetical protein